MSQILLYGTVCVQQDTGGKSSEITEKRLVTPCSSSTHAEGSEPPRDAS